MPVTEGGWSTRKLTKGRARGGALSSRCPVRRVPGWSSLAACRPHSDHHSTSPPHSLGFHAGLATCCCSVCPWTSARRKTGRNGPLILPTGWSQLWLQMKTGILDNCCLRTWPEEGSHYLRADTGGPGGGESPAEAETPACEGTAHSASRMQPVHLVKAEGLSADRNAHPPHHSAHPGRPGPSDCDAPNPCPLLLLIPNDPGRCPTLLPCSSSGSPLAPFSSPSGLSSRWEGPSFYPQNLRLPSL